jgi:hypothetical protein
MTDIQGLEATPSGRAWDVYLRHAIPCGTCVRAEAGKGCEDGRTLYDVFRLARVKPAVPNGQGKTDSLPLDRETMRAATARLLAADAESPSYDELETLRLLYRGNLMLLIPEVEEATRELPKGDAPRACAMACIGEARMRLDLRPGAGLPAAIAHAQHLARSVNALLDHLESLEVPR